MSIGDSFQILRPSSMRASRRRVCSSGLTSSQYLSRMMPESDHQLLEQRHHLEKSPRLLLGAEAHHALDAGAVVPAAVEDHDLAGSRQVRQVSLRIHLRFLALGRRRQRNHPEHARAHALGDRLDGAALAGAVAALEDDADLEALVLDPLLQLDQLDVKLPELPVVLLAGKCPAGFGAASLAAFLPCLSRFFSSLLFFAMCRLHRFNRRLSARTACRIPRLVIVPNSDPLTIR